MSSFRVGSAVDLVSAETSRDVSGKSIKIKQDRAVDFSRIHKILLHAKGCTFSIF